MVYEFNEHPAHIGMRMYRGEKVALSARDQKRLVKWNHRTKIIATNHSKKSEIKIDPKRLDLLDLDLPGGDESDWDPEDHLGGLMRISMGVPASFVIEDYGERVKEQLNLIKKS